MLKVKEKKAWKNTEFDVANIQEIQDSVSNQR